MTDMTDTEKDEILTACREMRNVKGFISTIKTEQEKLKLQHRFLDEKIEEEKKERKEEIKNMQDEFRDMEEKIENKFEIFFYKIGDINKRIDYKINMVSNKISGINKQIFIWMGSILFSILVSIIMLIISKINGWF